MLAIGGKQQLLPKVIETHLLFHLSTLVESHCSWGREQNKKADKQTTTALNREAGFGPSATVRGGHL